MQSFDSRASFIAVLSGPLCLARFLSFGFAFPLKTHESRGWHIFNTLAVERSILPKLPSPRPPCRLMSTEGQAVPDALLSSARKSLRRLRLPRAEVGRTDLLILRLSK
jgi:hypothetical protein